MVCLRFKYVFVSVVFLFLFFSDVSSAAGQGIPFSRMIYITPWGSDPGVTYPAVAPGFTILGSTSSYYSGTYTESQWTFYWMNQMKDLQLQHADRIAFGVGTVYFQSKKVGCTKGQYLDNGQPCDDRYLWYGGEGLLTWSIKRAHEKGIAVSLWQVLNQGIEISPASYLKGMENYYVYERSSNNAGSGIYKSDHLDWNFPQLRTFVSDIIAYGVSVTPELDGVNYEEPILSWQDYGLGVSYSSAAIQCYKDSHGGVNPLSLYSNKNDVNDPVRLAMASCMEQSGLLFFKELHDKIMASTTKTFPEFVIGFNSYGNMDHRYGMMFHEYFDNDYIQYYWDQFVGGTTDASVDYYNRWQYYQSTFPNYVMAPTMQTNSVYDFARRSKFNPTIAKAIQYGIPEAIWATEGNMPYGDANYKSIRQYLIENPPHAPSYSGISLKFNPSGGAYSGAQSIIISTSTAGATIRYTTDGTEPTETSASYSNPIPVSSTTTIKAKAWKTGGGASGVATATYTIGTAQSTNQLMLKPGWNQISSPIAAGIDISKIEQSCTILPYKNQKLWSWNAQNQVWINPAKIEPLKGYWIYSASTCTVPLSGTQATFSSIQLYNGWNKISASGTFSAIQGTCAGHITGNWVWNWDKATEKWVHPTAMQLDKGYWIKVDRDCALGG